VDLDSRANTRSSPFYLIFCPARENHDDYLCTKVLLSLQARQSPFWLKDLWILKAKVLVQRLNGMVGIVNAVLLDSDLTFYSSVSQGI